MVLRLDSFKADVLAALIGQSGVATLNFTGGAVAANGTYFLVPGAPYPLRIVSLDHTAGTTGMSFTVAINNAGTAVAGLGAIAVVGGAKANTLATGNQAVPLNGEVTAVITAAAGSPTDARLTLRFERA